MSYVLMSNNLVVKYEGISNRLTFMYEWIYYKWTNNEYLMNTWNAERWSQEYVNKE